MPLFSYEHKIRKNTFWNICWESHTFSIHSLDQKNNYALITCLEVSTPDLHKFLFIFMNGRVENTITVCKSVKTFKMQKVSSQPRNW